MVFPGPLSLLLYALPTTHPFMLKVLSIIYVNNLTHRSLAQASSSELYTLVFNCYSTSPLACLKDISNSKCPKLMVIPQEKEGSGRKKKGKERKRRRREGRRRERNKQILLFVLHPCHSAHDCHPSSSTDHILGFLLNTFFSPHRDSSQSPVLFPWPSKCLFSLFLLNLLSTKNEVITNIILCLDYCNNLLSLSPNHHCPPSNPALLTSFNSFPLLLG